ncbi:MAG TPA: DUF998 domain-containing protein [Ktedonobacterales bacterium]
MAPQGTQATPGARRDTDARSDRLTQWLLASGVVGPVLFVIVLFVEGATRPGYSAWRNFGSELSLSGQGWEQVANFYMCGLLCIAFAFGLRRALGSGRGATWGPILIAVFGLSLISAGIFTTDPALGYPPGVPTPYVAFMRQSLHAIIHGLSGLAAFASLAAACFVLARRFAGNPAWRGWALYSVLVGLIVAASFVAANVTSVLDMRGVWPNAPTGLIQRIGVVAGWSWVALLAARLLAQMRGRATAVGEG